MTRRVAQLRTRRQERRLNRRCGLEQLEERSLLTTLTVITHGFTAKLDADGDIIVPFEPGEFQPWVYDMATAIAQRNGTFDPTDQNGDGIADTIQNARIDLDGNQPLVGSGKVASDLLLFDWVRLSIEPNMADEDEVAGVLANIILERLSAIGDVHFIGHSRGSYVNMEVLRRLGTSPLAGNVGFVQMTTLDPQAYLFDGALEANPGGIVDFADNYYQRAGSWFLPDEGKPIDGVLNFDLTQIVLDWAGRNASGEESPDNHSEVHDWYHWTIDTTDDGAPKPAEGSGVPVINADVRAQLYGELMADLNGDGSPDSFENGAKIGYYFSVAGGGIGRLVHDSSGRVFTVDVRDGTAPLYLGNVAPGPFSGLTDIAYNPNGELFAIDFSGNLLRVEAGFDSQNRPAPTVRFVGWTGYFVNALVFRTDGSLFAAGDNVVLAIDLATGRSSVAFELPPGYTSSGDMEVDQNGNLYLTTSAPSGGGALFRIDADLTVGQAVHDLPAGDFFGLATVGGLLYGFRDTTDFYSVNLVTEEVRYRGVVANPALTNIAGATRISSVVPPVWHNYANRCDVNDNQQVSPLDALLVINELLTKGARVIAATDLFSFFCDVTNDGRITPLDALQVINYLLTHGITTQPAAAAPEVAPQLVASEQQLPSAPSGLTSSDTSVEQSAEPVQFIAGNATAFAMASAPGPTGRVWSLFARPIAMWDHRLAEIPAGSPSQPEARSVAITQLTAETYDVDEPLEIDANFLRDVASLATKVKESGSLAESVGEIR